MTKRQIIEIDEELCNGCGQCIPACEQGAIQIIEREAEPFDEQAVEELLARKDDTRKTFSGCPSALPPANLTYFWAKAPKKRFAGLIEYETYGSACRRGKACLSSFPGSSLGTSSSCGSGPPSEARCSQSSHQGSQAGAWRSRTARTTTGCKSCFIRAGMEQFSPCQKANVPKEQSGSALSHWPVQIRLVPAHAPFLAGADLLVTADCAPVASAEYHSRFLPGKVALMGCPKFDDAQLYVDKFTDILARGDINRVTVLSMEVPCCSGIVGMVKKARELAGSRVPIRHVVLSTKGDVKQEVDIV